MLASTRCLSRARLSPALLSLLAALVCAAPQPARADPGPFETVVRAPSAAGALRRSAEPVKVVGVEQARRESADLGEVLARTEGVGVRRSGALGSGARLSLNGLSDDQVRVLLDGIPLKMSGFDVGVGGLPVNFVQRIEIYGGVVPIRFGADALGGVVNVVTQPDVVTPTASVSYQAGSWDTHRLTAGATAVANGWYARLNGFVDDSRNDYLIHVQVPDDVGHLSPALVRRFHDAYRAGGGGLELGVTQKPWAQQLLLRGFGAQTNRQVQHNAVMTRPYGEVTSQRTSYGVLARYKQPLSEAVELDGSLAWGWTRSNFIDLSPWLYDWFGQQILPRGTLGESDSQPHDRSAWQQSAFGRLNGAWRIAPDHALQVSVAPTYVWRTGVERRLPTPTSIDPLAGRRSLLSTVAGLDYRTDWLEGRLQNSLFAKSYTYLAHTQDAPYGKATRVLDARQNPLGGGDMLRFQFTPQLMAKASYEYAARLPDPDELFGDTVLILPNPDLAPERSHNANLGAALRLPSAWGAWRAEANAFARFAQDLIILMGNDTTFAYQNVYGARSLGVQGSAGWTSPGGLVSLDAAATWQDFRNVSPRGAFAAFAGDRIPNRPWLFVNAAARITLPQALSAQGSLSLAGYTRYVQAFYRGWDSAGLAASKQTIPTQVVHSAALSWAAPLGPLLATLAGEVDNVLDSLHYDVYGVQLPGRSAYFKATFTY